VAPSIGLSPAPRKATHTNAIEGFWSILKRGIVGPFHEVTPKYLTLDVAEFQFQYNNRQNDDIFGAAIEGC
jgi:hypothetical protein